VVLDNVSSVSIGSSNSMWFIVTLTLTIATTAEAAATCAVATMTLIASSGTTTEKFLTLVDIRVTTNLSQFVPFIRSIVAGDIWDINTIHSYPVLSVSIRAAAAGVSAPTMTTTCLSSALVCMYCTNIALVPHRLDVCEAS
jgi:hypothetical protein